MTRNVNIDRIPGVADLQASCAKAADVTIAVIDGPIDADHSVFKQARLEQRGRNIRPADTAAPSRAHGTQVASILFGQSHSALLGVAPACRGLIIPVFTDTSDGGIRPCSELDLAEAIRIALNEGADIINISAGRTSGTGAANAHLTAAIDECAQRGALVVAAAGNDGCDCMHVPAALPGVLVVGAHDETGKPMGFSNWGEAYRPRGILAPGKNITSASAGGGFASVSGTSFAAPLVTGISALLMSKLIERDEQPDGARIREAIVASAHRCDPISTGQCERYLAGRLNVPGALEHLNIDPGNSKPVVATAQKGSVTMEQDQTVAPLDDEAYASPVAADGLSAQLKSLESMVASLSQNLGALQPQTAAPPPALIAEPPAVAPSDLATIPETAITPAACCDACAAAEGRQLVFALGKLSYDCGTEARMDSIQSQMPFAQWRKKKSDRSEEDPDYDPEEEEYERVFPEGYSPSVNNPADMVRFLRASPETAPALTWTLKLNDTPIYAILPQGFDVDRTFAHLVNILAMQVRSAKVVAEAGENPKTVPPPAIERMSLPGIVNGQAHLLDGLTVPSVRPARAGMFAWRTRDLVEKLDDFPKKGPNDDGKKGAFNPRDGLRTFLSRIYEELRNTGLSAQERAINFAATNAYQASDIFVKLRGRNLHIEKFEVVRSPVMRPDADCWDVKMTFYDPAAITTKPREVYFYTIDVSDVIPVSVGAARHWTTF